MTKFSLRFLGGTAITIVMIITLVCLGLWQLQRLEWKEKHTTQILNMDPKSFSPVEEIIVSLKHIEDVSFQKVKVKGTFYHDLTIELMPRTWHGQNGSHIYTPFLLSPSGHLVMINRGWVPENRAGVKLDNPVGEIELIGYLQQPALPGWLTPDNVVDKKAWYYLDLEAMGEEVAKFNPKIAKKILPFYMISIEQRQRDQYPKPIQVLEMVKNNHFGYALTWFFLAIALSIMYIFYIRQRGII